MHTPADLINFENQLDYIENTFWSAASLSHSDNFHADIEKKMFVLVNSSRVIQATLVAENKNHDLNLPRGTMKLSAIWEEFAGKGDYHYLTLRCSCRRCYGLYNKEDSNAYLLWLANTMIYNIGQFSYREDSSLRVKISDYFMAIKELRQDIVNVSKLGLFDENPQLSIPSKYKTISARAGSSGSRSSSSSRKKSPLSFR